MTQGSSITFDHLMSIGTACKTRYQIERILKARRPDWKKHTYFFDWLMCGGVKGVRKIVETGFEISPDEFCCDTLNGPGNHIPLHRPSGYRFMHDLGCTAQTRKDQAAALQAMAATMDDFLSKYAHIGASTNELLAGDGRVGLVYYGGTTRDEVAALLGTLKDRYGKSFTLINVIHASTPIDLDDVVTVRADDSSVTGTPHEWKGCDAAWDEAFAAVRTN